MTEVKKKFDKEQFWMIIMFVVPIVLLLNLADEFTDDGTMHVVYAGVLGGIGGLIGSGAYYLSKGRKLIFKILALVVVIGICTAAFALVRSQ